MLTKIFGNYPQVKVVDLLISHPWSEYNKKDIAEGAKIGRPTLDKFFFILEKYNLIKPTRKLGKSQLYKVNSDSPLIKHISTFQKLLSDIEAEIQYGSYDKEAEEIIFDDKTIDELMETKTSSPEEYGDLEKDKEAWIQSNILLTNSFTSETPVRNIKNIDKSANRTVSSRYFSMEGIPLKNKKITTGD